MFVCLKKCSHLGNIGNDPKIGSFLVADKEICMVMHKQSVYARIGNGFYVVLLLSNLLRVTMDIFVVVYTVHILTNALFIKLDKVLKFTLKITFTCSYMFRSTAIIREPSLEPS
jgi:hypothetical protein